MEQPSAQVNASIFRRYDIRGIVGQDLNESVLQQIGRALGAQLSAQGEQNIVLGRDGRFSGPVLMEALTQGLLSSGINVIDLGVVTTPMVYFAAKTLAGVSSCAVITGSHNPPDYNGIKIVIADVTLSGKAIQALYQRIEKQKFVNGQGQRSHVDIQPAYQQAITQRITLARPLRVVVDAGNGVAGATSPQILRALGCEVTELFCEVDGAFPNHHPDPAQPKNLKDLVQAVQQHQADLGLAFDGDGDRCGVVDNQGQILNADRQMMLLAADVLSDEPGAQIIYDIKCSANLKHYIVEHGGHPLMWKTGHSLMKAKMQETGAALAGELSGHIFFRHNWYGFDDGTYAAARLLQVVANQPLTSAELFATLPDAYSTPELEIKMQEGEAHAFMCRFMQQAQFSDAQLCTLDGLRVDFAQGWGLVRASNTAPNLVLRFEAQTEQALAHIQKLFRDQLLALQPNLQLPELMQHKFTKHSG